LGIVGKKTVWEQLSSCSFLVTCLDPTNLFLSRPENAENVKLQCMLARLICLVNIMRINVLDEKNISYVSDENIRWLDPHIIAAATADVLAVEKNARRMAITNGTCVSFCTF